MHNASYGRQPLQPLGHKVINFGLVRHVASPYDNVRPNSGELVDQLLDPSGHRPASGDQNKVASSLGSHPPGHASSEAASTSN